MKPEKEFKTPHCILTWPGQPGIFLGCTDLSRIGPKKNFPNCVQLPCHYHPPLQRRGLPAKKSCKKIRSKKRYFFCIRPLEKNRFYIAKTQFYEEIFFADLCWLMLIRGQRSEARRQADVKSQKNKSPRQSAKGLLTTEVLAVEKNVAILGQVRFTHDGKSMQVAQWPKGFKS